MRKLTVLTLILVTLAGCQTGPAAVGPSGSPLSAATPLDRLPHTAEVREVIQVRGYTYLRLHLAEMAEADEDVWAVSFAAPVVPGARIEIRPFAERTAFVSRQLGRTFDRLWFVTLNEESDG